MPSLGSKRKFLKELLTYFGMDCRKALKFMVHRTVYCLGGLQGLRDEMGSFLERASQHASNSGSAVDAEVVALVQHAQGTCAKSLGILRTVIQQLSAMDIEFLEQHPWASSSEEQRKSNAALWAGLWKKAVLSFGKMQEGALEPRTPEEWKSFEETETNKIANKKNVKVITQEFVGEIELFQQSRNSKVESLDAEALALHWKMMPLEVARLVISWV